MSEVQELKHLSLATAYEIDDSFDSDKFIKMRLRVAHDGINPNKSNFQVDDMEDAKDSIKNIPVLANVIFDEDGNPQFSGHDMNIEEDKTKEGEYRLIYQETPIGVVPENCNHEIKMFNNKNYVFVDCYVWKGYSNYAQDIIERDKDIKLSMEILVDEYSYNAKEKVYNIAKYRYQGITFLNKDFGTGMENALATTGTFEVDKSKEKFIMMMQELKDTLDNYDINNLRKGGSEVDEVKENIEVVEETTEQFIENQNNETIEEPQKYIKSFELSHEDVRYALYQLLSPVESEDNEWYFIDRVYDDKFEYENWEGTKIFRQGYKKENDVVSFDGERVELFEERLTKAEKEVLDSMRNNYTILESKVNEFEEYKNNYSTPNAEVLRLQKFESDFLVEQRKVAENEIFSNYEESLKDDEKFNEIKLNSVKYSLDELEKECALLYVRTTTNFSLNKKDKTTIKISTPKTESDDLPYEGIHQKYLKKNK